MLKKEPAVWTRGAALRARRSSGRPRAPAAGKSARAASLEGVFALLWWKFTTFQAVAWNLDGVGCWWGKKRRKQVQEEVAVREVLQKRGPSSATSACFSTRAWHRRGFEKRTRRGRAAVSIVFSSDQHSIFTRIFFLLKNYVREPQKFQNLKYMLTIL